MKLEKIRNLFGQLGIDGILIISSMNVCYMIGFIGFVGLVVILGDRVVFIMDFCYIEQVKVQVKGFEIIEYGGSLIQIMVDMVEVFGIKCFGFEQNSMIYGIYVLYSVVVSEVELVFVVEFVEKLCLIKFSEEIKILEEVVKIVDDVFRYILMFMKFGIFEIVVVNELEFYMRSQGVDSFFFDMIVVLGFWLSFLYGVVSDKLIESGDLVMFDFGVYYKGYCFDIICMVVVGYFSD